MKFINILFSAISCTLWFDASLAQDAFSQPKYTYSTEAQERRDQPVTHEDLSILERVEELLSSTDKWNPNDERVCDDDEANDSQSLFCALLRASIDVLGAYDHRRVALQEVRFAVEDAVDTSRFAHRLMEFNNVPETTLDDVLGVTRVAKSKVADRLKVESDDQL